MHGLKNRFPKNLVCNTLTRKKEQRMCYFSQFLLNITRLLFS
jgi:hypothetical protein